jgi:hypothetical protein
MELDDLKRRWQEQDAKLDAVLRLNARLVAAPGRRRAESTLRRASWGWGVEAVLNLLVLMWLASFAADHLFEPRFYTPAAWLAVGALLLLIAGLRQVVELRTIDFDAPVVSLQKRLERLRIARIRTVKWVFLLAPLTWTPMCIVGLHALFGFDAYAHLAAAYLLGNVAVGLLAIPIGWGIARWLSGRALRSPGLRRVIDDVGGQSLSRALRFLKAVEDLERDPLSAPSVP